MVWNLEAGGEVKMWVEVPEGFVGWFQTLEADPYVSMIDPYRDAILDGAAIDHWIAAIANAQAKLERAARAQVESCRNLPHEPAARAQVVSTLVEREIQAEPHHKTLVDLRALLELARESSARVRAVGD